MWLMTKHGFYSIVEKKPGIYHVRAREVQDLENLTYPGGPLAGERIREGTSDYPYRLIVDKPAIHRLFVWLADTLDYPNFKTQIDSIPNQRRKPYYRIWHLMLDELGGYGESGRARVRAQYQGEFWRDLEESWRDVE